MAARARLLIGRHLHRVVVVDDERRPVGIVSTADVLEAFPAQAGA